MSQKLATFKIDEERWESFKSIAEVQDVSASELLKRFVDWTIAGNQLPEAFVPTDGIEELLDRRMAALKAQLESHVASLLESRQGERVAQ